MNTICGRKAIGGSGERQAERVFPPLAPSPPNVGLESIRHVFVFLLPFPELSTLDLFIYLGGFFSLRVMRCLHANWC